MAAYPEDLLQSIGTGSRMKKVLQMKEGLPVHRISEALNSQKQVIRIHKTYSVPGYFRLLLTEYGVHITAPSATAARRPNEDIAYHEKQRTRRIDTVYCSGNSTHKRRR